MVELIKRGVINNSRKNLNKGKTVASFCMGTEKTYQFIDDNPTIEFRGHRLYQRSPDHQHRSKT